MYVTDIYAFFIGVSTIGLTANDALCGRGSHITEPVTGDREFFLMCQYIEF
jgi:hypothetical protein